jgi:HAD superfamily hydrolase (TIGR01549 family)
MKIQGVIFDMDGTLGDTVFVSVEAIVRTISQLTGKRYSHPEIISHFGPTEPGILQQLLPREKWEESVRIFFREYEAIHREHHIGAYPNMQEILDLLYKYNIRQAIVTGKSHESAKISLEYYNLIDYFEVVETGSVKGSKKEDCIKKVLKLWQLPPEQVLYIGDAPSDVAIAKRAGVRPISVSWATTADPLELAQEEPDALFEDIEEFKDWLKVNLNGSTPQDNKHVS